MVTATSIFSQAAAAAAASSSNVENTGSATSPAFITRTGAANPLNGQDVGSFSTPFLADLDGDGDLDLVSGEQSGVFFYYENTGTAVSPAFVPRTGAANPLAGHDVGNGSRPARGDFDGDGDLDLVAGADSGTLSVFENAGNATNPIFVLSIGAANPLKGQDLGSRSSPSLGDLDGEGDLDLVSGRYDGIFHYFESLIPQPLSAFELMGTSSPLFGQDTGSNSFPSLVPLARGSGW
jgi:hypothetical protein